MKKNRIYITKDDMDRLRRLIDGRFIPDSRDSDYLVDLEFELDRAEVVEPKRVPRGVITMNSEVRLEDLDTGEEKIYKLVFPGQSRGTENAVSVLAPIGTALLGYRVGDTIEWQVPKGMRRLKVLEVLYQPETDPLVSRERTRVAG